ncbi:hypothetical protein SDJN02_12067, partial [Cucurbita argyrosperma subsp. argyrosperma]
MHIAPGTEVVRVNLLQFLYISLHKSLNSIKEGSTFFSREERTKRRGRWELIVVLHDQLERAIIMVAGCVLEEMRWVYVQSSTEAFTVLSL